VEFEEQATEAIEKAFGLKILDFKELFPKLLSYPWIMKFILEIKVIKAMKADKIIVYMKTI
jgi:hypothetical protein